MELLTTLWTDGGGLITDGGELITNSGGLLTGSGGGGDELEIEGPGADDEDRW